MRSGGFWLARDYLCTSMMLFQEVWSSGHPQVFTVRLMLSELLNDCPHDPRKGLLHFLWRLFVYHHMAVSSRSGCRDTYISNPANRETSPDLYAIWASSLGAYLTPIYTGRERFILVPLYHQVAPGWGRRQMLLKGRDRKDTGYLTAARNTKMKGICICWRFRSLRTPGQCGSTLLSYVSIATDVT